MKRIKTSNFSHRTAAYDGGNSGNSIHRHIVHGAGTLTTSVGGVLNSALAVDPSTLTGTDWGDFSSLYDEFRVIGVRFRLISLATNSSALANNIGVCAFDNDSSNLVTSFSGVRQYGTSTVISAIFQHPRSAPFDITWWRPTSGAETTIPWSDVATPGTSVGSVQIYIDGLAATTSYLAYAIDLYTEFRGRR